ncbi:hypothetical protein DM02DRAFT_678091 [Periconia macrospinosa]|uniref:DUF7770 domain-containing protein n=1 Tax=Periconia macrospinosa TaxID=97972 RepID=A0A2V1D098_9PLEO|nr:hypothetical protein DM02DRAFT_678091 [Periconia macrospinosa]
MTTLRMSSPPFSFTSDSTYSISNLLTLRRRMAQQDGRPVGLIVQPVRDSLATMKKIVVSGYVAALPPEPATVESNPWVLVLTTTDGSAMVLELRESDPKGSTVVVCREEPTKTEDWVTRKCARSWPLTVRERRGIGTWLDILESSGLTTYQLDAGHGSRWWLDCVLTKLESSFLAGCGDTKLWLRMAWKDNGDPQGEMQSLRRGTWV